MVEAAVGQGAAESLVEEKKQQSDLEALVGEAVNIARAVPFQQGMALEFAEIVTKLIQSVRFLRDTESGEHRLVNLFRGPAADVTAAVQEHLQ